ncbi:Signal recognition particle receptor FtsY [Methanimicrococcus sp. At1]|uniref:Signal recognition particle receptor FtsY n=1 Tax=Methanimicrococcus hacksteinii TaxID=3028293 RepID=A0ABU3VP82_9EURY|nr:signal recognition particle-docking protein FtsY [Methanimicrococcus sp. At1]MDV0444715.1 Signal recognition particle receptor FtsY [Methanimicrococcus sp. At1]
MFGKLKEKLASFTKSLDKTVEEKAVELEEPEVVVEEEVVIEAAETAGTTDQTGRTNQTDQTDQTDSGLSEAETADIAEAVADILEEEELETVEKTGRADSEVMIEGKIEETASSNTVLEMTSETVSDTKTGAVQTERFEQDGTGAEVKKEKAGFFGKAKALIFDREVILDDSDLEGPLTELEIALLESDLALTVTDAIVESVREQLSGTRKRLGKNTGSIVEDALKNAIMEVMSANVFDFDEFLEQRRGETVHIAFVGINGTGKTTSIAKIANRLQKNGYSVTIAAGDTFRAGAIDQIQIHADRLGIKVIKHQEGSDPAAVIYDALQYAKAHKSDVLLSDTAGRMHTNVNLMAQLEKICRVSTPDLIIFVDEATAGNDAVERASQFSDAVPISGTILTKLDADSKGGAAISIAYITQKPILFFGVGQEYDDLLKFNPEWFVEKIFED